MSAQNWQLRRATADDLAAIMLLETSIFVNDAWSEKSMRAELANPHAYYLVAFAPERPDVIDGYAGLLAPHGAAESDIQTIAVAERARRHGLGRALVGTLIEQARRRGAKEVFLEVRADNPGAQRLYVEFGFEQLAVRRGYYQPDNVDAIVMRLTVPDPAVELGGTRERSATPAPNEPASAVELGGTRERSATPAPNEPASEGNFGNILDPSAGAGPATGVSA